MPDPTPSASQKAWGDLAAAQADDTDRMLFGDVRERPGLAPRDRGLVAVAALFSLYRFYDLRFQPAKAMGNGVSREEQLVELITHLTFCSGWPKFCRAADAIAASGLGYTVPRPGVADGRGRGGLRDRAEG